ncbi:hypothetical protein FIBSPDRAFT_847780 [Athelia psychrophila]|uniref:Uncharacterized protein n=1 Tax=Athelia psychrophila TaxID=1759441 RepID=A0A166VYE2_9AGAM|nr:hypothetical protein FIBSPDRAFT_847780 [Fibularhizoctonia sp. CBS 109695]
MDSPAPAASAPPRKKMPKGAERDPAAPCYTAGPLMCVDILATPALRRVAPSAVRDGSGPFIHAELESDTHDREAAHARAGSAHLNDPKDGAVLAAAFLLHYIDPVAFDHDLAVSLRARSGAGAAGAEVAVATLRMDGNQVKQVLYRPVDVAPGEYDLVVRVVDADGSSVEKASAKVRVE